MDAYTLGYTMYFFEIAVGISGYLNGVNPFDQPGVEAYKKKHVRIAWQTRLRRACKRIERTSINQYFYHFYKFVVNGNMFALVCNW